MYPGKHAGQQPDKPAIIDAVTREVTTYEQLEMRSRRFANFLRDRGLQRGDRCAVLAYNRAEVLEVYWATARTGLYYMPLDYSLPPEQLAYILRDSDAQAIVVSPELAEVAAEGLAGTEVQLRVTLGPAAVGDFESYEAAAASMPAEEPDWQPRGADMNYSSGTTGRPKGIKPTLPDREVHEPGDPVIGTFGVFYGFSSDTVYLSPAPLYHAAPLKFCATTHSLGGTVVIMPRFDAEQALRAIEEFGVTHSQWVPTHFTRMLALPPEVRERYDLSSHRVAVHAAAPCPVSVKQAMLDWWGPIVHEYYGATEAYGITMIGPEEWLAKPGSVGLPVLGEPVICDDEGNELPTGQVGKIYFKRDVPQFEYHNAPEKTRESRHPEHENWATVGDLGYLDDDGYLYLTGRSAFTIISGGVNIYPREVEEALLSHPKVVDVGVVAVGDEDLGERAVACVQAVEGGDAALIEELREHALERLSRRKIPKDFLFVDEIPRTQTGKLRREQLKAIYQETDD